MFESVSKSISTLPAFIGYLAISIALVSAFVAIYIRITPYREFAEIRGGNSAAGLALAGTMLGYAIPLASAISHSVGVLDVIIWGIIGLGVQLLAFYFVRGLLPTLVFDITSKRSTAAASLLATFSLIAGILSAACMTY